MIKIRLRVYKNDGGMHPFPNFDESLCYGCWACYNRCPVRAIYTKKLRGKGQYPGPTEELRKKLEG